MTAVKPDGLVHLVKSVVVERGTRLVEVKCGKAMPKFRAQDRLSGATVWRSEVTCVDC